MAQAQSGRLARKLLSGLAIMRIAERGPASLHNKSGRATLRKLRWASPVGVLVLSGAGGDIEGALRQKLGTRAAIRIASSAERALDVTRRWQPGVVVVDAAYPAVRDAEELDALTGRWDARTDWVVCGLTEGSAYAEFLRGALRMPETPIFLGYDEGLEPVAEFVASRTVLKKTFGRPR